MMLECVGGPLDGQSVEVLQDAEFRVPLPTRVNFVERKESAEGPMYRIGSYRVNQDRRLLIWEGEPGKDPITRPCDENETGNRFRSQADGTFDLGPRFDDLDKPEPWQ